MTFSIATWNVNSIRVRLDHILQWLQTHPVDVLALQETKIDDERFPLQALEDRGYHVVFSGQKTYNGVAILAKNAITEVVTDVAGLDCPQRRILASTVEGRRIINLYVPNGASLTSDKYAYKLHWLQHVHAFVQQQLTLYPELVVLGDFNIAPADIDVHNPEEWQGSVLVSEPERAAFERLLACGLSDSFRVLQEEAGHYSWWDYRAAKFRRDMGLRIDHVLLSEPLMASCHRCVIDKEPRAWDRPSDHAPVVAYCS